MCVCVCVCVSVHDPASQLIAYSSPLLLGKVLLFDYRIASVVRSVALPQMVRSVALAPTGAMLAAGCMGGSVFLIETESGRWTEMHGHRCVGTHAWTQLHALLDRGRAC